MYIYFYKYICINICIYIKIYIQIYISTQKKCTKKLFIKRCVEDKFMISFFINAIRFSTLLNEIMYFLYKYINKKTINDTHRLLQTFQRKNHILKNNYIQNSQ